MSSRTVSVSGWSSGKVRGENGNRHDKRLAAFIIHCTVLVVLYSQPPHTLTSSIAKESLAFPLASLSLRRRSLSREASSSSCACFARSSSSSLEGGREGGGADGAGQQGQQQCNSLSSMLCTPSSPVLQRRPLLYELCLGHESDGLILKRMLDRLKQEGEGGGEGEGGQG